MLVLILLMAAMTGSFVSFELEDHFVLKIYHKTTQKELIFILIICLVNFEFKNIFRIFERNNENMVQLISKESQLLLVDHITKLLKLKLQIVLFSVHCQDQLLKIHGHLRFLESFKIIMPRIFCLQHTIHRGQIEVGAYFWNLDPIYQKKVIITYSSAAKFKKLFILGRRN